MAVTNHLREEPPDRALGLGLRLAVSETHFYQFAWRALLQRECFAGLTPEKGQEGNGRGNRTKSTGSGLADLGQSRARALTSRPDCHKLLPMPTPQLLTKKTRRHLLTGWSCRSDSKGSRGVQGIHSTSTPQGIRITHTYPHVHTHVHARGTQRRGPSQAPGYHDSGI